MALIPALNALQERAGHLAEDDLRQLARQQKVPLHAVQAVVSFYPHFRTQPPPKAEIAVCRDMACFLAGSRPLEDRIESRLPAGACIHGVSCLGRCEMAPAVSVNHAPVDGGDVEAILAAASG